MIILLLVAAAQGGPRITKVERVGIDLQRPLAWTPLAVTLTSDRDFSGDLLVRSRFGFTVARAVRIPAGGFLREIVPALDPESVEIGGTSVAVPRPAARAELAVAVDARLTYADALESGPRVSFVKTAPDDLRRLLEGGMADGIDLLLLSDASGVDVGAVPAWVVAPTREAGERAVAAVLRGPRVEAVDPRLWDLAPEGNWVRSKRSTGVLFAAGYAFGGFALLVLAARRGAKAWAVAPAATLLAGIAGYAGLFPRGQVWIEETAVEIASPEGAVAERRIWFVGAAVPLEAGVSFPLLAKPVFRDSSGADKPFVLRVEPRGCRVEGLSLGSRGPSCFTASGGLPSAPAPALVGAAVREGRAWRYLDVLPAGAPIPAANGGEPSAPPDPRRAALERFFEGRVLVGWRLGGASALRDLGADGLADARSSGRLYVRRLE